MTKPLSPAEYASFLGHLKERIRSAQSCAAQVVNAELLHPYWDIEIAIKEGWGAAIIPKLSADLKNELPELKGFSARNLKLMVQFVGEYPFLFEIGQLAVPNLTILPCGRWRNSITWFW